MMIPMVDLKRQYLAMKHEINEAVREVLEDARFILGPNVSALEHDIAAYHGLPHAVGVANGTDALLLALRSCGIEEGDEVITTPFTFIATAEVVSQLRAVPVFADVLPDTFNIDPACIAKKISPRTRAIVVVHRFGHPAEMDPILEIARSRGLKIIEDCAQAFGAEYHGRKVGTMGNCGCFSFFPSKNLAACGDGGMIITKDSRYAERIRMLRNHGSAFKYRHALLGYNSRLDEIQAAILRVKFRRLDEWNEARRRNADRYRAGIRREDIVLPTERKNCRHVYHQFTLRCRKRDRIIEALKDHDIASAVYYPTPLHQQEVFVNLLGDSGRFPVSEALAAEVVSLPMFPELTEEEIRRISDVIEHAS